MSLKNLRQTIEMGERVTGTPIVENAGFREGYSLAPGVSGVATPKNGWNDTTSP